MKDVKQVLPDMTIQDGIVTDQNVPHKTAVEIAGDTGKRVEDGTKEGGVITRDLYDGKKRAEEMNRKSGNQNY